MEAVVALVGCALRRRVYIKDSGILIPLLLVRILGCTRVWVASFSRRVKIVDQCKYQLLPSTLWHGLHHRCAIAEMSVRIRLMSLWCICMLSHIVQPVIRI